MTEIAQTFIIWVHDSCPAQTVVFTHSGWRNLFLKTWKPFLDHVNDLYLNLHQAQLVYLNLLPCLHITVLLLQAFTTYHFSFCIRLLFVCVLISTETEDFQLTRLNWFLLLGWRLQTIWTLESANSVFTTTMWVCEPGCMFVKKTKKSCVSREIKNPMLS